MVDERVYSWLMDNADAPVRYRTARELLRDEKAAKALETELFDNREVRKWLKNLKPEDPPQHRSMEHGCFDFCLENALPKLVQLGLHSGISQMRDAVGLYFGRLEDAYKRSDYPDRYTLRLTENMLAFAGFTDDVVIGMTLDGIGRVHDFTSRGIYDFYLSAEERDTLKKVPAVWKDAAGFIKPEIFNNYSFSYPLIYDIVGMPAMYALKDPAVDSKINGIIEYISTDEFHNNVYDGYGILVEGNGKYHGMGWDPKYPGWSDPADYIERGGARVGSGVPKLLFFAQNIVKYPAARKTKWFNELFDYLEKYKTDNGTYLFPKKWIDESQGYAVQGHHLSFGENRRKKDWLEIESTFYMQTLFKYLN